ncbi:Bifunctional polymyxin resistance protein ArnA (plasmid) [Burkholderia sp. AD24]|nr:Bifunctional polymyxin resistance protein ArnA [Burkholderia sp. AD24]
MYSDAWVHPHPVGYGGRVNPIGPRSCYDEDKRGVKTPFMDYRRQHGLSVRIARIFNPYGPRMHPADGRLVSDFMMQALRGEPIALSGGCSQTSSFRYVDDMIETFNCLMNRRDDLDTPVNLGNPHEVSMRGFAQRILAVTVSNSPLEMRPLSADDPSYRQSDITRARKRLGWQPRTSPNDGWLHRMIFPPAYQSRRSALAGHISKRHNLASRTWRKCSRYLAGICTRSSSTSRRTWNGKPKVFARGCRKPAFYSLFAGGAGTELPSSFSSSGEASGATGSMSGATPGNGRGCVPGPSSGSFEGSATGSIVRSVCMVRPRLVK